MLNSLLRLLGIKGKKKKSAGSGPPTLAPNTTFNNSMLPRTKAETALALLELRLKEEQRIDNIKRLFRNSARTLTSGMEPQQTLALLEQTHPRIWTMIVTMWGSAELQKKFRDLIFVDSQGRAGFSFDVLAVLMRLHEIHTNEFGDKGGPESIKTKRGLAQQSGFGALSRNKKGPLKNADSKDNQRDRW